MTEIFQLTKPSLPGEQLEKSSTYGVALICAAWVGFSPSGRSEPVLTGVLVRDCFALRLHVRPFKQ